MPDSHAPQRHSRRALTGLFVLVLLSGCIPVRGEGGGQEFDEPMGTAAASRASCERSCQRAYDVCSDSGAARRNEGSLFGASAGCERHYKSCLPRCRQPVRPGREREQDHSREQNHGQEQY